MMRRRGAERDNKKIINTDFNEATTTIIPLPWEIEEATKGLPNSYKNNLLKLRNQDNALSIAKFIIVTKNEINLSDSYRRNLLDKITYLSKFHNTKSFKEITHDDFIAFLNSFRKPEPLDPLHKSIGTYNQFFVVVSKFFKWLYYPDLSPKERLKQKKPAVIDNLTQLSRREKTTIKPTDLWTIEEDLLFLKYCPSIRERCYHTIARDTGCRPSQILKLRIKDVTFKISNVSNDRQYAEILANGKTGPRSTLMTDSIPYVKDWLDVHPQRTNPNAYFIFGNGKSYGKRLNSSAMWEIYNDYKIIFFPKLLLDPSISPEDKLKIKELLKKPWNPYIRRHTGITDNSKILPEPVLRQYAGWTMNSNMPQKYIHFLGNESNELILEARGLKPKSEENRDKMKPKQCNNCSELNKIDSKFCGKCRMVLSYDAYTETIQESNKVKNEIDILKEKQEVMLKILEKYNRILDVDPQFAEECITKTKHIPGYKPPKILIVPRRYSKQVKEFLEKRKKEMNNNKSK